MDRDMSSVDRDMSSVRRVKVAIVYSVFILNCVLLVAGGTPTKYGNVACDRAMNPCWIINEYRT